LKVSAGLLGYASRDYSARRLAEVAAQCESLGLDGFWAADQRWGRDVWVLLAACAMTTSRLFLGTRVIDPYSRHPAMTAVALATLQELSGGRAVLGIGAGGSGFREMGIRRDHPVVAIREAVELIRALMAGGLVEYDGALVRLAGAKLEFGAVPAQIVVVSRGPRLLQLGGEIADGVMIASLASAPGIRWARAQVEAGMATASRQDPLDLSVMAYISMSDDPDAARAAVRRGIAAALIGSNPSFEFLDVSGLKLTDELRSVLKGRVDAAKVMDAVPTAYVERLAIAGTPTQCLDRILELQAEGLGHIVLAPLPVPGDSVESLIASFAREVLPQLRRSGGGA
jgi:5,10-methylenetetrahydromethanopterin reductase